jgi:hypothetical protein
MLAGRNMFSVLENHLNSLKMGDAIVDWRSNPGYGYVEYTVEFQASTKTNLKNFAKDINKKYGAFNFTKHKDDQTLAVKFVIKL